MGGGQTRLQAGNLRYAQTVNRARTETQRCLLLHMTSDPVINVVEINKLLLFFLFFYVWKKEIFKI